MKHEQQTYKINVQKCGFYEVNTGVDDFGAWNEWKIVEAHTVLFSLSLYITNIPHGPQNIKRTTNIRQAIRFMQRRATWYKNFLSKENELNFYNSLCIYSSCERLLLLWIDTQQRQPLEFITLCRHESRAQQFIH